MRAGAEHFVRAPRPERIPSACPARTEILLQPRKVRMQGIRTPTAARRMRLRRTAGALALAVAALLGASSSPVAAQSAQPWSIQGSVLAAGQDIGGSLVAGFGVEAQLRYTPPSLWSFGGGIQWSSHSDGPDQLDLVGVFFEPRYTVDIGSDRVAPYVAGRVALLRQTSDFAALPEEVSSNGAAVGGGGGLLFRATSRVNLDIGAALLYQTLGDATTSNATVTFGSFMAYVAKAGVSIGFGTR